ncbi:MFS transporter [Nonomuraea rhizosphaerae]|uniref:MFS transporter n=1 Tax=Nonomuraea rhizosphaerae TaxID=2665663 RepID=UPI001C5DFF8C|nr:MFS transporter [Nonomuraea rhizosphaerae]
MSGGPDGQGSGAPSPRSWSRRLFWPLLAIHAILVQVISYGMRPSLSYAVLELGYGSAWVAVVAAMFAIPPLVLAVATGRLVDRFGERPSMVIGGVALTAAAVVAYLGSAHLALLVTATALLGLGIVFSMVAEQSAVAGQARNRGMDSAFGVYTFITSLGQGVGPLLLLMPPAPGSQSPPLEPIAAACGLASLVTLAVSFGFGTHHRTAPSPARRWPARQLLAIPGMYRALLVGGLILASIDVTLAYLPALAHARGIAPAWVTAMLGARSVAQMVSRINLAFFVRVLGRRRLTVAACAVSALALCGLTLPVTVWVLIALTALYGFAAGVCQPITMGWVTQLAPSGTRGTVLSLRIAGNRLAQSVIPAMSGAAAVVGGVSGVLAVTGATLGVAAWSASAIPDRDP